MSYSAWSTRLWLCSKRTACSSHTHQPGRRTSLRNTRTKEGIVYKFWSTPVVIAYDPDKLAAERAPKSWLDLTRGEYKGKYVIGNTAWQTTRVYLAGILARFLGRQGRSHSGWMGFSWRILCECDRCR
ncbi:ABC transporter substrate-binding protein [Rhizobium beringeri]